MTTSNDLLPSSTSSPLVDESRLMLQRALLTMHVISSLSSSSPAEQRGVAWREYKHAVTASDSGSFEFVCWVKYMNVCMYTLCHVALYEWLTETAYGFGSLGYAYAGMHACMTVLVVPTTVSGDVRPAWAGQNIARRLSVPSSKCHDQNKFDLSITNVKHHPSEQRFYTRCMLSMGRRRRDDDAHWSGYGGRVVFSSCRRKG